MASPVLDIEPQDEKDGIWVFGYGSLIWRPAFKYIRRRGGYILNYKRRFWQGSIDHRGIPENPGRVVTIVPNDFDAVDDDKDDSYVWGMCYQINPSDANEIFEYLDMREQGGYTKTFAPVFASCTDAQPILPRVLLYMAAYNNPQFLGPAPHVKIAQQIIEASGGSGKNVDYLLELARVLRENKVKDKHVEELERCVYQIMHHGALEHKPCKYEITVEPILITNQVTQ